MQIATIRKEITAGVNGDYPQKTIPRIALKKIKY